MSGSEAIFFKKNIISPQNTSIFINFYKICPNRKIQNCYIFDQFFYHCYFPISFYLTSGFEKLDSATLGHFENHNICIGFHSVVLRRKFSKILKIETDCFSKNNLSVKFSCLFILAPFVPRCKK